MTIQHERREILILHRTSFVVTDRRAHGRHSGIVCVKAASRHEIFTVASDGSAALWRLAGSIPKPICVLQGLPNYGSGLRSSNVSINACMKPKPRCKFW